MHNVAGPGVSSDGCGVYRDLGPRGGREATDPTYIVTVPRMGYRIGTPAG